MPLEAGLLEILACPACHAPLREEAVPADASGAADASGTAEGSGAAEGSSGAADGSGAAEGSGAADAALSGELICTSADCGLVYPIRDGIPVLLVDEARRPA